MHYSEKRSYQNSINFFKQIFTWCKSHSPAVNCDNVNLIDGGILEMPEQEQLNMLAYSSGQSRLIASSTKKINQSKGSTNYKLFTEVSDICKRTNLSIIALILFCLLFVLLCCSYITIISLYFFVFNGFMALTKQRTEPQMPLLTATVTATQRREITKTSSQN